jgi:hypothetical protein
MGGVAIALPFLEIMGTPKPVHAAGTPGYTPAGFPKRFIVFFSPNGTIPDAWRPSGTEYDFQLSRILAPLEPLKDKIIVINGVDQQGGGGDGHQNGMGGMLTGQMLNPGPFENGDGGTAGWANGISVDQRIAQVLGNETKIRSLELSVQSGRYADNWNRMAYLGPDEPVPPDDNPYSAFSRLFSDLLVDKPANLIDRQRTVLGAVMADYSDLSARLGSDDRQKLDAHLNAIREIEARLGVQPKAALDSCQAPTLGSESDVYRNDNFPLVGQLQMDLLVMALACDLTRVASIQWNRSVGDARFTWLDIGIDRGHHDMSHDGDSNADTIEKLTQINIWYAEQFAYLVDKLQNIPEGTGTMLDNTVVLWCNELGKGNSHTRNNAPYVLAGSAGGYFKTGRYLSYDGTVPHNNLLLSLVQSMGIADSSFGKADWCTGPLSGLV